MQRGDVCRLVIAGLERLQECRQIALLPIGQSKIEALLVKRHNVLKRRCHPVVEIGRASCEAAQDRPLEFPNVRAFSSDQRPPRIRRLYHGPIVAEDREQRQVRRPP